MSKRIVTERRFYNLDQFFLKIMEKKAILKRYKVMGSDLTKRIDDYNISQRITFHIDHQNPRIILQGTKLISVNIVKSRQA